jgi:prevent-host-death family protein
MATVNVHDAKTHFSRLITRVESGEEIIIAKAGRPVARIVPLAEKPQKRKPGTARGRITVDESFFEPLPEDVLRDFEN